jgi:hypothetical protein
VLCYSYIIIIIIIIITAIEFSLGGSSHLGCCFYDTNFKIKHKL